ncbi:MAG: hypothetical protein RLZZ362_585, partial [Actinomycetota bacterium]
MLANMRAVTLHRLRTPASDRPVDVPVDVVVDLSTGAPTVLHWGAPLSAPGDSRVDLGAVVAALARPVTSGGLDLVAPISVVPEHGSGFDGRPGLMGHRRRGTAWSPRFGQHPDRPNEVSEHRIVAHALDPVAELELITEIELGDVLSVTCTVVNVSNDRYLLHGLTVSLPVPAHAAELLTLYGRWTREFHLERRPFGTGSWSMENRLGRTSHERPPLLFAAEPGVGEWHGEVWGAHLAWGGNHTIVAEQLPDGRRCVHLGELLHPGEISLGPGESYRTPTVLGTYSSAGLTAAAQQFHRYARRLPAHPTTPRPVLLNTWEASYFDHDRTKLFALATTAAEVGIERFVLDDGWFGSRRNDRSGLGDWTVSPDVYPDGLGPLVEHVSSLGMEFGIWVEPEM